MHACEWGRGGPGRSGCVGLQSLSAPGPHHTSAAFDVPGPRLKRRFPLLQVRESVINSGYSGDLAARVVEDFVDHMRSDCERRHPGCCRTSQIVERERRYLLIRSRRHCGGNAPPTAAEPAHGRVAAQTSPSSNAPSRTAPAQRTGWPHATRIAIEIVRKHPDQIGFAVHPPWGWWSVSSRGLTAIGGSPRTSKPALPPPEAFLYAASVTLLTRRLAIIMSFEPDSDAVAFPKSPGYSI